MKITLLRPLAFIDIESTGTNKETDRIIEISICKLFPDGTREVKTRRVNPGIHIPPETTEIHGIKDEDVVNHPSFLLIAKSLLSYLEGCDIAGFGSNAFDVPILFNEFNRVGIYWDYTRFKMIDAGNIFKIQEPRTLTAAVKFYCNSEHVNAHSSEADVLATVDVFLAQMERYDSLPGTVEDLAVFSNHGKALLDLSGKFSFNEKGEIILNFGPKRGQPAVDHVDFIEWMYYKADFPPDTRSICEEILEKRNAELSDDELEYPLH